MPQQRRTNNAKGGNAQRRTRNANQQQTENFQQQQPNFQQDQGQRYDAKNPYPQQNQQQNQQQNNGEGDYDNELHGAMFKNQRKFQPGGNPNWPDYSGNVVVEGVKYWMSGWMKRAKNGSTYLSISLTPEDEPVGEENLPF